MLRSPKTAHLVRSTAIKIVLTGGGSGGHITPLPPLGRALKKYDPKCEVIYIGLKGDRIDLAKHDYQVFDKVHFISSGKFRRYHGENLFSRLVDFKTLLFNLRDVFKVIIGTISALKLLRKIKPDVVFSKGGFVVVPVGLAAWLLNIPIVTHDSDAAAGMANKIVGRWAKIHTTGAPPENYSYPKETIRYVGIPISDDHKILNKNDQKISKTKLGIPADSPVLLIAGGGLGSRTINELVIQIVPKLVEELPKLQIIHITGEQLLESVQADYAKLLDAQSVQRVKIFGYSDQFSELIAAADLVIARAGATTLAELELQAKACIIIPAAFLAGGHQLKNAQLLKDAGAAVVIDEQIPPQDFLNLTLELLSNEPKRLKLSEAILTLARPQAANELAEIIINQALEALKLR